MGRSILKKIYYWIKTEEASSDEDRTRIYHSTEMDGAIQYGMMGRRPPLWLQEI